MEDTSALKVVTLLALNVQSTGHTSALNALETILADHPVIQGSPIVAFFDFSFESEYKILGRLGYAPPGSCQINASAQI